MRVADLAAAQRRLTFAPPALNAGGTVSNADFTAGPVAPGSLVSIFGTGLSGSNQTAASIPLPGTLGTTSLTLGGVPVPLIHAFPLQVDAQVPWELAGQTQAPLTIVTDDLGGNTVTVPLAQFSPGVYTANGTGSGQGASSSTEPPSSPRPPVLLTTANLPTAESITSTSSPRGWARVPPARYRRTCADAAPGGNHQHRIRLHRRRPGDGDFRRPRPGMGRPLSGQSANPRDRANRRCRPGNFERRRRRSQPGDHRGPMTAYIR